MARRRIGIVGASGNQGQAFIKWLRHIPDAGTVTALCETRREKLDEAVADAGAAGYSDLDRMLAEADIDTVIIGTPDSLHAGQTIASARAGKAVLCEKPLGMTVDEAEAMLVAVRDAEVGHAIHLQHRSVPCMASLKDRLDRGELGELVAVNARISVPLPDAMPLTWRQQRGGSAGGALADCGSHVVDLANWLFGGMPERVVAFNGIAVAKRPVPDHDMDLIEAWGWAVQHKEAAAKAAGLVETPDHTQLMLVYAGNRLASIRIDEAETLARIGPYIVVEAHGRKATALCRIDWGLPGLGDLAVYAEQGKAPEQVSFPETDMNTWMGGVMREALAAMDARAKGMTHAFPGFGDGVNVQRVIEAGRRSAADCAWVCPS